ncbi:MAG: cell division protein FtsK, partial [Candidatus Marinimicrobia bacterium]|nr:cell division protein FtsK [Candidatus Neomarinimicrobiota bacterium]
MKYFEIITQIDKEFFNYDNALQIIEDDYPENQLPTDQYGERKQRLQKTRRDLEAKVTKFFATLDGEIKKLRLKQPHFNENLQLQKREIFPEYFIFGRINISHDLLKEKNIPRVIKFPLSTAQYSYNETNLAFIYQYILRVLQISPLNKLDFILIDPKTIGKSFNFLRPILNNNFIYNQKILTVTDEIDEAIKLLSSYLENILQKQLSGYKNWKDYNRDSKNALLPLKVLVINGYPNQFSSEALLHLDRIIE